MHGLTLPDANPQRPPAFDDLGGALAWLSQQPQAQPLAMLQALDQQVLAIDGAALPTARSLLLLGTLREATATPQSVLEARYLRKPLPLNPVERQAFQGVADLWLHLGVAFLRLARRGGGDERAPALYRASSALRNAQYAHFAAARELPPLLRQLLVAVLADAHHSGYLVDPPPAGDEARKLGANLAWAMLLCRVDPYRLGAAQLAAANRLLGRWRELPRFLTNAPVDPGLACDIAGLFPGELPAEVPHWIDLQGIRRKIAQRRAALQHGETPEALHFGRDLSAAACRELLDQLEHALSPPMPSRGKVGEEGEEGEYRLHFGGEHAYAVFTGKMRKTPVDRQRDAIDHQRMALFGFDRLSQLPGDLKSLNLPGETWLVQDGQVVRQPQAENQRLQAPCLIAARWQGKARLGILYALRCDEQDRLSARLAWFSGQVRCGLLASEGDDQRSPAFLIDDGRHLTLLLARKAALPRGLPALFESRTTQSLTLGEEIQRGCDFVSYRVTRAEEIPRH